MTSGREQQIKMVAGPRNHLYRTPIRIRNSRPFGAGFFVLRAEVDHGGDLADDLDLQPLVDGPQHDLLDETTQDLERFAMRPRLGQRLLQVRDLLAIDFGQVGMEARCWRRSTAHKGCELLLPLLELLQPALEACGPQPVGNRIDEAVKLARDLLAARAAAALARSPDPGAAG